MRLHSFRHLGLILLLLCPVKGKAEYLFTGDLSPTGWEEFIMPNLAYEVTDRYSEWDLFYAFYGVRNYPDRYAVFGGLDIGGVMYPDMMPSGDPNFPDPDVPNWRSYVDSSRPNAFWSIYNPTLTQVGTVNARITGGGNIYSFQEPLAYVIKDTPLNGPDGFVPGTVVMQFQTDGMLADFSSLKLIAVFNDGERVIDVYDQDRVEYLREYKIPGTYEGEGSWSAGAGYRNRVAVQWDLSNLTNDYGDSLISYRIEWDTTQPHVSLQQLALDVVEASIEGGFSLPAARIWDGGDGSWNDGNRWFLRGQYGGYGGTPEANGNIRFQNTEAAQVNLNVNQVLGELVFESSNSVHITSAGAQTLTVNTGVTTLSGATGNYRISSNYHLGALNFFEIHEGNLVIDGRVSGSYGLVKTGSGRMVLAADNTFTSFIGIQDGTLRIEGRNVYTGETKLVNGRLELAADALAGSGALGNTSSTVVVGADASLYQYVTQQWLAELVLDGDRVMGRNIAFAAGNNAKRLAAINTGDIGAIVSGALRFTQNSVNPDATDDAAGAVFLTAQTANDSLILAGEMTGGHKSKWITLDGAGTVVYQSTAKSYHNSTRVASGTLLLDSTSGYSGVGDILVDPGAKLLVNGSLSGTGNLTLSSTSRLEGKGTVNRAFTVENGAILAAGEGIGTLAASEVTFAAGGIFEWELGNPDGSAGTDWDFLQLSTSLTISSTLANPFILSLQGSPEAADTFDPQGTYRWHFASVAVSDGISLNGWTGEINDLFSIQLNGSLTLPPGGIFSIETTGSDLYLNYRYETIPEPSTWVLLLFTAGLGFIHYRRTRRPSSPRL